MLLNMLVLFGIIGVIQAPLHYMVGMPNDQMENAIVVVADLREDVSLDKRNNFTIQSVVIGEMKDNPQAFIDGVTGPEGNTVKVDEQWVNAVKNFNFDFMGLNLAERPTLDFNVYLILPILSVLTMFASQIIIMKTSGTAMAGQGKNTMLIMTLVMGVMFGYYAFTVPVGFSLYYTISNVVMTAQQLVLRRIYDPKKIQEDIRRDLEEKKLQKKAKKVVTDKDKQGNVIQKEMTDSEIARWRLERARQLDEEKYAENRKEEYQTGGDKIQDKSERNTDKIEAEDAAGEDNDENIDADVLDSDGETQEVDEKTDYKPGRRKRARMKKEGDYLTEDEPSFADKEMKAENQAKDEEEK